MNISIFEQRKPYFFAVVSILSFGFFFCLKIAGKKARVNKKSGSKSGSFDREKASVFVRNGPQKLSGNAIGYPYQYPSVDVQVGSSIT